MKTVLTYLYKLAYKLLMGTGITSLPLIAKLNTQILDRIKTNSTTILGHQMYLDTHDSLMLSVHGIYEEYITELISKLIKPGDYVIDIGAHIGYYTLILAKLVGPTGHVFAFEPDPHNFDCLTKNIQVNKYRNTTLTPTAISKDASQHYLFLSEFNTVDHKIYPSTEARRTISVKSTSLDTFFSATRKQFSFLKMDIQGSEYIALQGMKKFLQRNPHLILLTEFWPKGISQSGHDPKHYLDELHLLGFNAYEIDPHRHTVSPYKYTSHYHNRLNLDYQTNLLFSRRPLHHL